MSDVVACTITGEPIAQGSKRLFGGRIVEANDHKLQPWRDAVAWHLVRAKGRRHPITGPVEVTLTFRLHAPQRRRLWWQLLADWHAAKPDIDKLARAVLDALTMAAVVNDDSQVAQLHVVKMYATDRQQAGVLVVVSPLLEEP